MHILIRDASNVHLAEVTHDALERPKLRASVGVRADGRVQRMPLMSNVALEDVERVNARGAVAMCAEAVDVAEERGVGGAV